MFTRVTSKFGSRAFSAVKAYHAPKSHATHWAIASSTTLIGVSLYILSQKPVYNDVPTRDIASTSSKRLDHFDLRPLVWGCNQNHLIAPERESKDCIKTPTPAPELFSSPLRDLAFCTGYAACVDAGGNVYQWGDAFFNGADASEKRRPHRTLQGKNIISIAVTPSKIFALSTSGKLYALSSSLNRQSTPSRAQSIWDLFSGHESQSSGFIVLDTDVPLRSGEKFTSITAGSDHLLALTSQGRTFAHPVTRLANCHGQLGLRKISVPDPADVSRRVPLELTPQTTRDTGVKSTMRNPDLYLTTEAELPETVDIEQMVGLCDCLFEVPALRDVNVQQIVAGDRSSFAVTRRDGRVLGWGANEYGQLGLGANVTLPNITAPTEVVLNKFTDRGTITRCVNIAAGGDLTLFTVERDLPTRGSMVDVLACGNGQWGGLGNASFSNAQGTPVKVKNISGILEYDELTKSLTPLKPYHVSVAPGPGADNPGMTPSSSGHVITTLETIPLSHPSPNTSAAADAADAPGRDVLAWGLNRHYQLGFRKRGSVNAPAPVLVGSDEGRLMCRVGKVKVKDFDGRVVGQKMQIEQRAVAGPGVSIVYWRIV